MGIADKAKDSYPAQLGQMLGEGYDVRNFGVSGRTMLRKGDYIPIGTNRLTLTANNFVQM